MSECQTDTILVSFEPAFRCVNCGADLEQKVNGVIKYVIADKQTSLKIRNLEKTKMAKKGNFLNKAVHEPIHHKTSIGRRPSLQKMNKNRRRTFKLYKGQGR